MEIQNQEERTNWKMQTAPVSQQRTTPSISNFNKQIAQGKMRCAISSDASRTMNLLDYYNNAGRL